MTKSSSSNPTSSKPKPKGKGKGNSKGKGKGKRAIENGDHNEEELPLRKVARTGMIGRTIEALFYGKLNHLQGQDKLYAPILMVQHLVTVIVALNFQVSCLHIHSLSKLLYLN
jgi:hypothetical protein